MLNDTERHVMECIRMRLTEAQSFAYLKANDHDISRRTFYRIKGKLEAEKFKRLSQIAQMGFVDQHLERIDHLEIIQKLMWENYHMEKSSYKRVLILIKLVELQPYISAYYDITRDVLEHGKRYQNDVFTWPNFME